LVRQLQAIGLTRVQLDLDPLREQPSLWGNTVEVLTRAGIRIVSGMFRSVGEDYTTLETIRLTGGLVPDATWEENWRRLQDTVQIASRLGLKLVMFHAGFLPHQPGDPAFAKMIDRLRRVGRLFAERGIVLGCETGQETAAALKEFLVHLNEPNVAVNFDPANMILYNNGDPIAALRHLGTLVKSCHVKDAIRTRVPGMWGDEVVVGTGQVDWLAFFTALAEGDFAGDLFFEREAGSQRVADIRAGVQFVEQLLAS
jgi:sugar phosphate isomerase/epimerase